MGLRVVAYIIAGSFINLIHDLTSVGSGIYILTGLCFWRAFVNYRRMILEERHHGR